MFSRDDLVDMIEGFLTVFVAGFTAAVLNGAIYQTPNIWAVVICTLGGLLAAVRKMQAHRASSTGRP